MCYSSMMANETTPDVCCNVNQFNARTLYKESSTSSLRLFPSVFKYSFFLEAVRSHISHTLVTVDRLLWVMLCYVQFIIDFSLWDAP